MRYFLTVIIIALCVADTYSQDSTLILGKKDFQNGAAIYDLSDPTGINIEVNLWGFIRYPGRYRVPINTRFMDLMSYAGGPLENSKIEDMRIIRTDSLMKTSVIVLNYGDVLWGDKVINSKRENPFLQAGDVIVVPEERRYSFRDNLGFYLPIITSFVTIATFIITVSKK